MIPIALNTSFLLLMCNVFPDPSEGQSMNRAWCKLCNSRQMRSRAISLVAGKSVFRVPAVILLHDPVTRNLGNNRCRCYGLAERVAFFYGLLVDAQRSFRYAVDEKTVRINRKLLHCELHGTEGCLKYVYPVNRQIITYTDTDRNRLAHDPVIKFVAHCFGELFRIVDTRNQVSFRKDHSSCDYRPGKRPPAGFIHSGNGLKALPAGQNLKLQHVWEGLISKKFKIHRGFIIPESSLLKTVIRKAA